MFRFIPTRWKEAALAPLIKLLAKTGVSPNWLSLLGFATSLGAAWVIAVGQFTWGGVLVLGCSAFDLLDGTLARATGRSSRFGALLDSTLDRFSEAALLFGLLVFYIGQGGTAEILLIYATVVGSVLVSYVRARAEGLGVRCEVGILSRTERVVLFSLGLIFHQVLIVLWIMALLTNATAVHRVVYVWQKVGREKPSKTPEPQPTKKPNSSWVVSSKASDPP